MHVLMKIEIVLLMEKFFKKKSLTIFGFSLRLVMRGAL